MYVKYSFFNNNNNNNNNNNKTKQNFFFKFFILRNLANFFFNFEFGFDVVEEYKCALMYETP